MRKRWRIEREIKFRAWDKENEKMLEVANISFDKEAYGYDLITIDKAKESPMLWTFNGLEDFALMQYTGLKDINEAEVYFNDIVEDEYGHRYEVVFEGDCLRCNGVRKIRGGHKPKNRWFGRGLKIIGNIYENPELLETEE